MEKLTNMILGGWIGVVGASIFFVGAAIATSVGVWNISGAEFLNVVRHSTTSWRWGNVLLSLGTIILAVGMFYVASKNSTFLARFTLILWLIAGVAGLGGFILQGEGTLRATWTWQTTAEIPSWFMILKRTSGIAIGIFMICGIVGSVAFGWLMYTSNTISAEQSIIGIIVLIVAIIFAIMNIPAAVVILAGWIFVMQLLQSST